MIERQKFEYVFLFSTKGFDQNIAAEEDRRGFAHD
jgi:hypothetical protein